MNSVNNVIVENIIKEIWMAILLISDNNHNSIIEKSVTKIKMLLDKGGYQYKHYEIANKKLNHCIGCFSCWLKTPGICIFNDIASEIAKDYVKSDVAIFISNIRYGTYSVPIRRVLDRQIPNILPFFEKVNNEIHHSSRYNNYPEFVVVGCGEDISDFEIETFKSLADANAINFKKEKAFVYVCRAVRDIDETVQSLENHFSQWGITRNEKNLLC